MAECHDAVAWIRANVALQPGDAVRDLYERMPLQSGGGLPGIFYPYDGRRRADFADQGRILDFALVAGPGRVLDFGPGDGWPSLRMAPLVREVVGVDGSVLRVRVCADNAARLGIENARFEHVAAACPLPFPDGSFDGATAASSVEQTPDPKATLAELYRVLKPGARLRMEAETLDSYRGGAEREMCFWAFGEQTLMVVYERKPDEELVDHYVLELDLPTKGVSDLLGAVGRRPVYADLSAEAVQALRKRLTRAATWRGRHPSLLTYMGWMREIGFSEVRATHSGGWFAGKLFERLEPDEKERFQEEGEVIRYLRPIVEAVVEMEATTGGEGIEGQGVLITGVK